MQIQVHSCDSIQGGDSLARWAETELNTRLARFKEYITRVEVFFTSTDMRKSGSTHKRCVLETRATGRQPIAVNAEAEKMPEAFHAAVEKLMRAVDNDLGRAKDKNLRESIRTDKADLLGSGGLASPAM